MNPKFEIKRMYFKEIDLAKFTYHLSDKKYRAAELLDSEGNTTPYIITSDGILYKVKKSGITKIKKQKTKNGYIMYHIRIDNIRVGRLAHRMVAEAFIYNPDPINKIEVNHKDGIKTNNHVSNLEWVTKQENLRHALQTGLKVVGFGENSCNPKITEKTAREICKYLEENKLTLDEIAEKCNTTRLIVYNIKHKLAWVDISNQYKVENHKVRSDGTSRLEPFIVHNICMDLEENKLTMTEISDKYEISYNSVKDIVNGYAWRKVSKLYDLSKYTLNKKYNYSDKVVKVCEELQKAEKPIKEISKDLGVSYLAIYNILIGKNHTDISKKYDFTSYKENVMRKY